MAGGDESRGLIKVFPVGADTMRRLIPTIFDRASFPDPRIEDITRIATAWRTHSQADGQFPDQRRIRAQIRWLPTAKFEFEAAVVCNVTNETDGAQTFDEMATQALMAAAESVVNDYKVLEPARQREAPEHNPVVGPGERFEKLFTGTLRDYSGCARVLDDELKRLQSGSLPLGVHWFGWGDRKEGDGQPLFLSEFANGGQMEHDGVLVCAPQNSGKTMLVVRWALAAALRTKKPYGILIIDVKGNMSKKLAEKKIPGEIYRFSTDPRDETGDRINFLDGPMGLNPIETDRIRQLATALIPSRGFVERGGVDEYHYKNEVVWMTAFIHILKLAQHYRPDWFTNKAGKPRNVDLADVYDLLGDEGLLFNYFNDLTATESELEDKGFADKARPHRGIGYWFSEIAIMLDPDKFSIGQRVEKDTYFSYTIALRTAIEPFARGGTLFKRTSAFDDGPGRLFDLETVLRDPTQPVTVLLSARQQDLEAAEAVLALVIKRLQWFLFNRMAEPDAKDRPLLLLLDETRRIRDFNAAEYITFAREAKACCVIVYQALDQIGPREKIVELLENIGTQIYLGSLVGNTARYFIDILPKRWRPSVSSQIVRSPSNETVNTTSTNEQVDYFSTTDLYRLPSGRFPALVHINDLPHMKPFLVDMTEYDELRGPREPDIGSSATSSRTERL